MRLPRGDEYLAAVQNPSTAFSDPELKVSIPDTDQFGIPKPYSGGFTTTFHLRNHSQHWAVRCFTRTIPDLQRRYEAIGRFLQTCTDGFFVKAICLNEGIRVGNQWHPIIKMQWLDGETLNTFIDRNISKPGEISKLIPEFVDLVKRLESLKVAHGISSTVIFSSSKGSSTLLIMMDSTSPNSPALGQMRSDILTISILQEPLLITIQR